jgi:tRNA A37 threonylcarbamoyladenosine synthetase subunit TsaC/SUA5/YrdC
VWTDSSVVERSGRRAGPGRHGSSVQWVTVPALAQSVELLQIFRGLLLACSAMPAPSDSGHTSEHKVGVWSEETCLEAENAHFLA